MQYAAVLGRVTGFLEQSAIRYAIAGGLALQAWGHSRLTFDIDLLVEGSAQQGILSWIEGAGYETLHRSEGYSNHVHPSEGRIDFIYVYGETAEKLFTAATRRQIGSATLPVPRPEHLAALKVLAMKNDPARRHVDMADIQFLALLPHVDRSEIRNYFEQHGLLSLYDELR